MLYTWIPVDISIWRNLEDIGFVTHQITQQTVGLPVLGNSCTSRNMLLLEIIGYYQNSVGEPVYFFTGSWLRLPIEKA